MLVDRLDISPDQIEAISCYTSRDKLDILYIGTVSDELEETSYHVYIINDCISLRGYERGVSEYHHSYEIEISDFKSYIRERKIVEVLNGI